MKRLCMAVAIAFLCLPQLAATASAADDPVSIVRDIYLQFAEDGEAFDVAEAHFSPELLKLWHDVDEGAEGDVEAALGFSVFNVEGPDETIEIDNVRLLLLADKYVVASYAVVVEEAEAIAAVKKYFQYNFEETADGWKIDDIDWGPDRQTLRDYLTEIIGLQALK